MLSLLLFACTQGPDLARLEARLAELEAAREADAQRIAALETRLASLGAEGDGGAAAGSAPAHSELNCSQSEGRLLIPEAALVPDELARSARVTPHRGPDGESDGFRLSAIRRGGLLDSCGVKNGDIVHAVNGLPLTSPEQMLQAWQQLEKSPTYSFAITRRGAEMDLEMGRTQEASVP